MKRRRERDDVRWEKERVFWIISFPLSFFVLPSLSLKQKQTFPHFKHTRLHLFCDPITKILHHQRPIITVFLNNTFRTAHSLAFSFYPSLQSIKNGWGVLFKRGGGMKPLHLEKKSREWREKRGIGVFLRVDLSFKVWTNERTNERTKRNETSKTGANKEREVWQAKVKTKEIDVSRGDVGSLYLEWKKSNRTP